MKLNFYDVDKQYTDHLRKFDDKIPYIECKEKNNFRDFQLLEKQYKKYVNINDL